jgi:formamidopyrimidine-DNA glycosylase
MPELPEIETVASGLRKALVGRRILTVTVRERRLRRPVPRDLATALRGRAVTGVSRHGKFLRLALDGDGLELVMHLGMSGTVRVQDARSGLRRHDHVTMALDDGRAVIFHDPRRFGLIMVGATGGVAEKPLGVDPVSGRFTADVLVAVARGRRRPIKNLLMDQSLIAGLGNIYANEILAVAGVRPGRASGRLSRGQCGAIVAATLAVLEAAIRRGGSSISDFHDAAGRPGGFQTRFLVYDREGQPCRRCRTAIRRRVLGGRSAYYCPRCQR